MDNMDNMDTDTDTDVDIDIDMAWTSTRRARHRLSPKQRRSPPAASPCKGRPPRPGCPARTASSRAS
eukprot:6036444-Prymnesium_polylepis.1